MTIEEILKAGMVVTYNVALAKEIGLAAGWLRRSKKKDNKGHFYSVYELKTN